MRARSSLRLKFTSPRVSRGAAAVTDRSLSLPLCPLPLRRIHSEENGEPRFSPRLSLTPRRTKCATPASRLRGFAEGVASSGKAEIASRSPRCSEIASRSPRCSELMPEKVFSEKVSTLLFSELKRARAQSRQAAAEATAAEALRVAEAEAAEAAEAEATAAEAEVTRQTAAAAAAAAAGASAKAKEAEGRAEAAASAEIEALRARAEGAELRLQQAVAELAAVREAGEHEALALQAALSSEASCSAEEWGELQRQIVIERRVNAGLQAEQGEL